MEAYGSNSLFYQKKNQNRQHVLLIFLEFCQIAELEKTKLRQQNIIVECSVFSAFQFKQHFYHFFQLSNEENPQRNLYQNKYAEILMTALTGG